MVVWFSVDMVRDVSRLLLLGIALAAVQLAVVLYAVDAEREGAVTLLYMAIPAVLTLGWAYARRDDPVFPTRVAYVMAGATALQLVVYLALDPGGVIYGSLTAGLIVAMVFCMAIWSGSRGW